MKLKDKVAVVTGAGQGLGQSHSVFIAREGAKVVVNDINYETASRTADLIGKAGGIAIANSDSVAMMNGCEKIIQTAIQNFGRLDILVNCAAVSINRMIWKMTEEEWDRVVDTTLKGTWACMHFASPYMKNQNCGKIINVTSNAGHKGYPGMTNYAAAKEGIVGLTKAAAKDLARYNIQVNCICPRAVTQGLLRDAKIMAAFGVEINEKNEVKTMTNVQQRIAYPEEISPLVVFLASDEANYITGQVFAADGGVYGL